MLCNREIDDTVLDDYLDCYDLDNLTPEETAALEMLLCPMR